MKKALILAFAAMGLILSLPVAAQHEKSAKVCSQCNSRFTEAEKKFSVVMPKVPGMGPSSYDDIGCAVMARNSECASRQMTFDGSAVVHDYLTAGEVPVETAYFVFKAEVSTPRGYGIVAFKDRAQAERFVAEHGKGKVIRWFELVDERLE